MNKMDYDSAGFIMPIMPIIKITIISDSDKD